MALDEAEVGDEHLDQRLAHFFEQARPYFHRQSDEELPEPYVDFERLACFWVVYVSHWIAPKRARAVIRG